MSWNLHRIRQHVLQIYINSLHATVRNRCGEKAVVDMSFVPPFLLHCLCTQIVWFDTSSNNSQTLLVWTGEWMLVEWTGEKNGADGVDW